MARKGSGGGGLGILFVLVVSAVSAAYKWAQENIEIIAIVGFIVVLAVLVKINSDRKKQAAWVAYLKEKYKKDEIVNSILNSEYWKGQTSEQLLDSLGTPHAIDKQVLKTKTKETWKYHEQRKGQFALRILVENNHVVGWDAKS
jgi:hypothetical protein